MFLKPFRFYSVLYGLLLACAFSPTVSWSEQKKNTSSSDALRRIIEKSGLDANDLGLLVQNERGEEVFSLNSRKNLVPASISKIPTAVASLETWTPGHRFSTQIYADGRITNGTLQGDIILKGLGEPALVSERLWFLVNALTRYQIKKVTGDIIVDESYFDSIRYDKDRLPMSEGRAFDAPVSALSFNWNAVNVYVQPSKASGSASVFIDPENSYITQVSNRAKTVSTGSTALQVTPVAVKQNGQFIGDRVEVSGQISLKDKEMVYYRSISEPDLWAGAHLKEFLKQRQVEVMGAVKRGQASSKSTLLIDEPGEALRENVNDMMKFSNNFIAEMLAKHLSIEAGARPGNLAGGVEVIRKTLDRAGLDRTEYSFVSPSGLSTKNKMSAGHFNQLLHYALKSKIAPEFLASLPIAGVDGTLKSRLKTYNVRAKTGLLTGVSSLAGVAYKKDGTPFVFTFMYNGPKHFPAKDVFEDLIVELLK
jgi:D-alanyl-D-alanine carboxypeptidase/D-alanyl-D-alanine-endopeptidase (penicillin-binding protein 4)